MSRKVGLSRRAAIAIGLLLRPTAGRALDAYPSRPVKIIVPIGSGGSTDVLTRVIGEALGRELGANFIVENRPGAGGNIGMQSVVRSTPDGYTLASATVSQFVINPLIYKRMPYDPGADLTYISILYELANALIVSPMTTGARNLEQFAEWARARRVPLNFSSAGVGTTAHLLGELLGKTLGVPVQHIAFRGNVSEAGPAMIRGDIHFSFDGLASWLPFLQSGDVIPLLVTSDRRSSLAPETPTVHERGMAEFATTVWAGLVGPKNLPPQVTDLLSAAAQRICGRDEMRARIRTLGAEPLGTTSREMSDRADRDRPLWARMAGASGASVD